MFVFISVLVTLPSNRSEHPPALCTTALQPGAAAPCFTGSAGTPSAASQPALEHFQGWDLSVRSEIWKYTLGHGSKKSCGASISFGSECLINRSLRASKIFLLLTSEMNEPHAVIPDDSRNSGT